MKATRGELGELEGAVMRIVWAHPALNAEEVRARLGRPLKEATVRTVLRRLEEKGFLTHRVDDRTFVYSAAEPRHRAAARAIKRIIDWFCDGAADEVLVGMVDADMLDQKQLDRFVARVAQAKRRQKKVARRPQKGARS
ncbi:MAG TPA: BlaI/MecI/CopY family transcriptional regulator [Steroidobacteraceae bacterium]|nr:BlaI/MecI/CopY family transcriptional regulator [Steroidobacteraceae bacterium]